MPHKPKIFVCQNSTFWLRLYVSSHTFSKSLRGIFASFLLVKLVKKLGNLSDFGKSMWVFARKSETDIQKQTVRIWGFFTNNNNTPSYAKVDNTFDFISGTTHIGEIKATEHTIIITTIITFLTIIGCRSSAPKASRRSPLDINHHATQRRKRHQLLRRRNP